MSDVDLARNVLIASSKRLQYLIDICCHKRSRHAGLSSLSGISDLEDMAISKRRTDDQLAEFESLGNPCPSCAGIISGPQAQAELHKLYASFSVRCWRFSGNNKRGTRNMGSQTDV
jgi:hypothetical protein